MNSRVERMFGPRESWGKGNERERVEARAASVPDQDGERIATAPVGPRNNRNEARGEEAKGKAEGVKGFLSIRCGGCDKVVNTCLHEVRTIFNCKDCGHPNPLEGMKTMTVECPRCSFRGRYRTNRDEKEIVMECLNCSQPVRLRKGYRRGNYATVKTEADV